MGAILFKSVPIFYSKTKILYFDAIDKFDDRSFKYLERTNNWNPMARVASHKIDFKKHLDVINKTHKKGLKRTVARLYNMAEKGNINFGFPIGLDNDNGLKEMNEEDLRDMTWVKKDFNLVNEIKLPFASSSTFRGLLNVGQGLSFVDESKGFLYDVGAGPGISYAKYKAYLNGSSYDAVISHMHYDHYKFLPKLFKDGMINKVYLPKKIFVGKRLNKFFDSHSVDIEIVDRKINVCGYEVEMPPTRMVIDSDVNTTSLLASGFNWLLTGDSTWGIIKAIYAVPITVSNIIVPHHGSLSSGLVSSSMFNGYKNFYVSHGDKKIYGHPDDSVIKNLEKYGVVNKVTI